MTADSHAAAFREQIDTRASARSKPRAIISTMRWLPLGDDRSLAAEIEEIRTHQRLLSL